PAFLRRSRLRLQLALPTTMSLRVPDLMTRTASIRALITMLLEDLTFLAASALITSACQAREAWESWVVTDSVPAASMVPLTFTITAWPPDLTRVSALSG